MAWDALPASYQDDVTGIVHAYAANVDRELWNQGFALARRVSMMLRNKKDIILAMPKFQAAEGFDAERVSREWDFVMAPILTIADSELANVDSLQELDVRRFLGTTGVEFMQDIIRISAFAADDAENKLAALGQTQATLVSRDGDNAVVQIAVPGQSPRSKPFVRVEGKWIPKDIADEWADEMDDARAAHRANVAREGPGAEADHHEDPRGPRHDRGPARSRPDRPAVRADAPDGHVPGLRGHDGDRPGDGVRRRAP